MKTRAIAPAAIDFDADGPPFSPTFGDLYHPRVGALAQACHVFIAGSRLHERWCRHRSFTILETGFGLGNNFLAAWSAWRQDAARSERLLYLAIDAHPPCAQDLRRAHAASPLPELASALVDAWPPLLPNLHLLPFDQGRVQLMLGFGDVAQLLPQIRARVDAFFLDGYAPSHNPQMWQPRVIKGLARLAAVDATVATWTAAAAVRKDLVSAGFELHAARGIGGKRDITLGTYAPRHTPRRATVAPVAGPPQQAIVIGAGLAGAWAAHALAQRGISVTVIDRQPQPAAEASGNPAGIFHPTVHGDDGPHAQLLRAAALFAHQRMRPLIDAGLVPGQSNGLLRLVSGADALRAMQAQVRAQGLPESYVQALAPDQASDMAGVRLSHPAWYFAQAGWVAPAALVRQLLGAPSIGFVGGAEVHRLCRIGEDWAAFDATDLVLARAPALLLANADGASALLAQLGYAPWPLQRWRGQVSGCETVGHGGDEAQAALRLPVAGDGYALPLAPGHVLCGASSHEGDEEAALREHDHRYNFERLQRLTGMLADPDPKRWHGRVGWRVQVPDRLAIAGPMPLPPPEISPTQRLDQARWVPRSAGLYVTTALGGRGITLAPLLGELLAAQICGEALPMQADLVDAIDPARWLVRQARCQQKSNW